MVQQSHYSASQSSVVGSNLSFQQFHNTSVPVGSALRQQVSRHPNVFNVTPPVQSPQVPQHHIGFISGVPPPLIPYTPPGLGLVAAMPPVHLNAAAVQSQQPPPVALPFWIDFAHGNISRCNGCRGKIERPPPPNNLILQYKEKVLSQNPNTGMCQLSREPRNVYYHAKMSCISPHFCDFNPAVHIRVDATAKAKLTDVHIRHISEQFNLNIN